MTKQVLYRVDRYINNMGDLIGFRTSFEGAKSLLGVGSEYQTSHTPNEPLSAEYGQISQFVVYTDKVIFTDALPLNEWMKWWGKGEPTKDYYFRLRK